MDDRAKQLAALLKETYRDCGGSGERAGIFAAVAAVLAPIVARVEQSEAQISRMMYPGATEQCWCGHLRMNHAENGYDNTEPCCNRDCTCRDFSEVPRKRAAPPQPIPQPGPTRGAEVQPLSDASRREHAFNAEGAKVANQVAADCMTCLPAYDVEVITCAINRERRAARAQAFTEAEEAVRSRREGQDRPESRWAIDAAAGEVRALRLREVP